VIVCFSKSKRLLKTTFKVALGVSFVFLDFYKLILDFSLEISFL